ncbi:MAG TPA: TetR/AcrR family transcriptional regulator [Gemmatimonadaceae bacterium]|nr:TetR/AcrR family transcriptional regulator [Gemmatimonadaceae bacterium]
MRAPDETRARILDAAARVYARLGYQGCTTRLIATEAGVNEVTLFRLFGSKDSLLDTAIQQSAPASTPSALPASPRDPAAELTAWCAVEIDRLRASRVLLRRCFAEEPEHPDHVRHAALPMERVAAELRAYLRRAGLVDGVSPRGREDAAIAMLISALLADALGRDTMQGVFPDPVEDAPARYVETFLAALGG